MRIQNGEKKFHTNDSAKSIHRPRNFKNSDTDKDNVNNISRRTVKCRCKQHTTIRRTSVCMNALIIYFTYLPNRQRHPYQRTWSDYLPIQVNSIMSSGWIHWLVLSSVGCAPKSVNPNFSILLLVVFRLWFLRNANQIMPTNEKRWRVRGMEKETERWAGENTDGLSNEIYCYGKLNLSKCFANTLQECEPFLPSKSPSLITRILFSCISNFFKLSNIERARCGTDVKSLPPKFKRFSFLGKQRICISILSFYKKMLLWFQFCKRTVSFQFSRLTI